MVRLICEAAESDLLQAKVTSETETNDNNLINGLREITLDTPTAMLKTAAGDDEEEIIDYELVGEARELLRAAYEQQQRQDGAKKYSRLFYEQLMDPNCACTCWRYLRHNNLKVSAAVANMKATLLWREENQVDQLAANKFAKDFWLKGPIGKTGVTRDGKCTVIYVIGKQYRRPENAAIKAIVRDFVTHLLFGWDQEHRNDFAKICLVFDNSETGIRNIDLDFSSWVISIRDNFPARVRAVYFIGVPFIVRPLIRLIISWLPENWSKIVHCGTAEQLLAPNMDDTVIPSEAGGKANDLWRLAPPEAPWAHEVSDRYPPELMAVIERSICYNLPPERLEALCKMQEDHDAAQAAAKAQ